jgi:hypothetical protein
MRISEVVGTLGRPKFPKDLYNLVRLKGREVFNLLRDELNNGTLNDLQVSGALHLIEYIASDTCGDYQNDVFDISMSYLESGSAQVRTQAALNIVRISGLWETISKKIETLSPETLKLLAGKAEKRIVVPHIRWALDLGVDDGKRSFLYSFILDENAIKTDEG